jgi:hypothetical protein
MSRACVHQIEMSPILPFRNVTLAEDWITVAACRIAPRRYDHPANRLKEAQGWPGSRIVVPGLLHHVTRRGNRREPVFFAADDYRLHRRQIAAASRRAGAVVWAYCLMPNHVQLIVTPADADGLRPTFAEAAPALHRGHQRSTAGSHPWI